MIPFLLGRLWSDPSLWTEPLAGASRLLGPLRTDPSRGTEGWLFAGKVPRGGKQASHLATAKRGFSSWDLSWGKKARSYATQLLQWSHPTRWTCLSYDRSHKVRAFSCLVICSFWVTGEGLTHALKDGILALRHRCKSPPPVPAWQHGRTYSSP